jgi:hypothetical protein
LKCSVRNGKGSFEQAHAALESGTAAGKIVVDIGG